MFSVDLNHLQRARAQKFAGNLEVAAETWESWGAQPLEPVRLALEATMTGTGQLLVRGTLRASITIPCRRCVDPVQITLDEPLDLLWLAEASLEGEEDGEVRVLPDKGVVIALEDSLREELFLRIPTWVVCREDCAGLCPSCGADLTEGPCACANDEGDPRWDALRNITFDQRK